MAADGEAHRAGRRGRLAGLGRRGGRRREGAAFEPSRRRHAAEGRHVRPVAVGGPGRRVGRRRPAAARCRLRRRGSRACSASCPAGHGLPTTGSASGPSRSTRPARLAQHHRVGRGRGVQRRSLLLGLLVRRVVVVLGLERLGQRDRLGRRGHDRPDGSVRAAIGGEGVRVQVQRRGVGRQGAAALSRTKRPSTAMPPPATVATVRTAAGRPARSSGREDRRRARRRRRTLGPRRARRSWPAAACGRRTRRR